MDWIVMRQWADLARFIVVMDMSGSCHGRMGVLKVVRNAYDLTWPGKAAAAASPLMAWGLVKGIADAQGLGGTLRRLRGALRRLRKAFRRGPDLRAIELGRRPAASYGKRRGTRG